MNPTSNVMPARATVMPVKATVMPAKATAMPLARRKSWIPAFAGMTARAIPAMPWVSALGGMPRRVRRLMFAGAL